MDSRLESLAVNILILASVAFFLYGGAQFVSEILEALL